MKLRTEMQDGCVHANGYCVNEDDVEFRQAERLVHDAACAHALMQAMDENVPSAFVNSVPRMRARASELLRSWGFDSGEDANETV